jgi:predicted small secreted protein
MTRRNTSIALLAILLAGCQSGTGTGKDFLKEYRQWQEKASPA